MSPMLYAAEPEPVLGTTYEAKKYQKPDIEVDDFELLVSTGFLSIEDFGVSNITLFNLNYHVNESFFIQAGIFKAQASETSFEVLTGNSTLLTDSERRLNAFQISVGYNLFPGEGFFSENHTFSTDYYVIAGIGTTEFAGNERYTLNYGTGFRAAVLPWLTIYSEVRNYVFDMDVFGVNKSTNNLSFTLGLGFVF